MILLQSQLSGAYCNLGGICMPVKLADGGWVIHAYNFVGHRFGVARYAEDERELFEEEWHSLECWLRAGAHGLFSFSEGGKFYGTSRWEHFSNEARAAHREAMKRKKERGDCQLGPA